MLRKILGVVAGVLTCSVVVYFVEAIGHMVYPPPPGLDFRDPEAVKSLIGSLPVGALLFVVVAWVLGAFAGGAVAGLIARSLGPALVIGIIQLLFIIILLFMIPHPVWMLILGLLLPIPAAWAGGSFLGRSLKPA